MKCHEVSRSREGIRQTVEKLTEQYTQQHEANLAEERLAEEISVQAKALTDINKCETTHFTQSNNKNQRESKGDNRQADDIQTDSSTRKAFPQITRC